MKKISLLICVMLALMIVTPALAREHQPSGERINIFYSGTQDYPAGAAFYIMHGWQHDNSYPMGLYDFKLEVDGVYIKETYHERIVTVGENGPYFQLNWVFNFPNGMTGVHTFRGHWFYTCQEALDLGNTDMCAKPNALFEAGTSEVVVTFTP